MILFPAFWPPVSQAEPKLANLHHTPFRFYVRVPDASDSVPAPSMRYGRQSLLGYDNFGTYEPLVEPAQIMRIAGDPKMIDGDAGDLLMTVYDIQNSRWNLRRFSNSVEPAENIWTIENSIYSGGNYQFLAAYPARLAAVVDRSDGANSVQFKRYSDGDSWYFLPNAFYAPPTAFFSGTGPNLTARNLALNGRDANRSYRRAIASNEWCYAAGFGGDVKRIVGFKGRSLSDPFDAIDEVPAFIPIDGPEPIGNLYSINGVAFLGGDHCVMQATYIEPIPNPNPNIVSPQNPWRTFGALYCTRVYRVDLINGRAEYTLIARVVNQWQSISGTPYFQPFLADAGGSVITALCMTPDGELLQTYPWNGANVLTSGTFESFTYVSDSLIIGTTRRLGTGAQNIMAYSRNGGSSWVDLPLSVYDGGLVSAHVSRGAYCVRKDLRVKKARKDWIISQEIQI